MNTKVHTKLSIREDCERSPRSSLTSNSRGEERSRNGNWLLLDDEYFDARYVGNMAVAVAWVGLFGSLAVIVSIIVMGGLNLG